MCEPDNFTTWVLGRSRVAEDTVAFELERPAGFEFEAGQFVSLRIPDFDAVEDDDGERMLSIASAPHDPRIMVAMRMRDSAFKRHLASCGRDAELLISPAMGDFLLPPELRPIVMIAGGIGITPFYSMLCDLRRRARNGEVIPPVTLLYANRTPLLAAWRNELESLVGELDGFTLVHVFGDDRERAATKSERVRVRAGLITTDIICNDVSGWDSSIFYVVGPAAMVAAAQDCLDDCGVPPEDVVVEFFAGY